MIPDLLSALCSYDYNVLWHQQVYSLLWNAHIRNVYRECSSPSRFKLTAFWKRFPLSKASIHIIAGNSQWSLCTWRNRNVRGCKKIKTTDRYHFEAYGSVGVLTGIRKLTGSSFLLSHRFVSASTSADHSQFGVGMKNVWILLTWLMWNEYQLESPRIFGSIARKVTRRLDFVAITPTQLEIWNAALLLAEYWG